MGNRCLRVICGDPRPSDKITEEYFCTTHKIQVHWPDRPDSDQQSWTPARRALAMKFRPVSSDPRHSTVDNSQSIVHQNCNWENEGEIEDPLECETIKAARHLGNCTGDKIKTVCLGKNTNGTPCTRNTCMMPIKKEVYVG